MDDGLRRHAALALVVAVTCTLVWAAAGAGTFWPAWVWLGAAVTVTAHTGALHVARTAPAARPLAVHAWVSATVTSVVVAVWLVTSPGSRWVLWPVISLGALLSVHAVLQRVPRAASRRELELTDRVAELTRTRRDAVDVQALELRRIERDLHDGAQALLVALSMQLGRAQLAIASHPQAPTLTPVADLVQGARQHADTAIAELRHLVQGIAPPILADRGLVEAVGAVARRAGTPVTVRADVVHRSPPAVEVAAYFIVAEAVTNAVKHARTAHRPLRVDVELTGTHDRLTVRVADDGVGGADPGGGGLAGLAQRVAALDGTFTVGDARDGGTVLEAVLGYGHGR